MAWRGGAVPRDLLRSAAGADAGADLEGTPPREARSALADTLRVVLGIDSWRPADALAGRFSFPARRLPAASPERRCSGDHRRRRARARVAGRHHALPGVPAAVP